MAATPISGDDEEASVWDQPTVLVDNGAVKALSLSAAVRALVGIDGAAATYAASAADFENKFLLSFHTCVAPVRVAEKLSAVVAGPPSRDRS